MAFEYTPGAFGGESPDAKRRRLAGVQKQQTSNRSPLMTAVQGFTQSRSGHMPSEGAQPAPDAGRHRPQPITAPPVNPNHSWSQGQPVGGLQYGIPQPPPPPLPPAQYQPPHAPWQPPPPGPSAGYAQPPSVWQPPPAGPSAEFRTPPSDINDRRTFVADPGIGGGNGTTPPSFGGNDIPPTTPPASSSSIEDAARAITEQPPLGATDPSQWDTDGYPVPGYTSRGSATAPPGWDPTKWADQNHQSPKYVVGRILSDYPPTVAGLQAAMADIQKAYPNAKLVGNDKIDLLGNGSLVDVLQGAASGGVAWQFNSLDGGGEVPAAEGGGAAAGGGVLPGEGAGGGGGETTGTERKGASNPMLNNPGMTEAFKALMQALGFAVPDTAGMKEASKENLLAARAAESDALAQGAQARGLSRSGLPLAAEAQLGDNLASNLTKSYRDIDLAGNAQAFQNLMGIAQGFQSHGSEQFGQEFSLKQLEQQAAQHAAQMGFNYAQLSQQDRQFFQSLALNRWIAEKNNDNRLLELMMGR